jgi:hypothetical protein
LPSQPANSKLIILLMRSAAGSATLLAPRIWLL